MARKLSNLQISHISEGAKKTKEYIHRRRIGEEKSLLTSFPKLNSSLLNGVDWYRIFTVAGLSGSGKSTILENIKRDFIKLNPYEDFDILSFEFEMRIEDQLARHVSSVTDKTVKQLYSADAPITSELEKKVSEILDEVSKDPIYYVDQAGTVPEIVKTILEFVETQRLSETGRGLVVTIDHVLLTKDKFGENEKKKVDSLMHQLVALKKLFSSIGVKCLFIVLSQLNRDIEEGERVLNKALHYPTKNDIFAASSVYYCSDYVLITHRPSTINGITAYGPANLPILTQDKKSILYWHLIKERFGETKILSMVEDFASARIKEFPMQQLKSC